MEGEARLTLNVTDASGQRTRRIRNVPPDANISEMVAEAVQKIGLADRDPDGRPIYYQARLECEGRHLNGSEVVRDALKDESHIILEPRLEAGGGSV